MLEQVVHWGLLQDRSPIPNDGRGSQRRRNSFPFWGHIWDGTGWEWRQPDIYYQGIKRMWGWKWHPENPCEKLVVLYGVYWFGRDIPEGYSSPRSSISPRKMPEWEGCFRLFCEVTSFAMPLSWDFWIHFGGRPCCPACLGINALRRSLWFLLGGSIMTRWSREGMGFFWFCVRCLTWNSCFQTACAFSKAGSGQPGICQSHLAALFSWFQKPSKTFQTWNTSPKCATLSHVILRSSHILLPDVPVLFPAFIASRSMQWWIRYTYMPPELPPR